MRKKVSELKRKYINHKICISTTRKQLFKISSDLMSFQSMSCLMCLPISFTKKKICQLRENIDTASDGSNTDPFDHDNAFCGQSLAEFEPVSEMEVRETILKCPPKSSEAGPIPTSLLREMINENENDCLLPPFTVPCKMVLARPDERET